MPGSSKHVSLGSPARGVGAGLVLSAVVALAALLARDAGGAPVLPTWLAVALQLPAVLAWCFRVARQSSRVSAENRVSALRSARYEASVDLRLTLFLLPVAAALAVGFRDLAVFFAATTTFIVGMLLLEVVSRVYRRASRLIVEPTRLVRSLVGPWFGLMFVATLLLALPLATDSAVPDYSHNFWLHVLNSAYAAVSAACLVGTAAYSVGEEYSLFGQVVLLATTQLAGMGLAAVGLAVIRPFLAHAIRLRTVLFVAIFLQVLAILAMWGSWHETDAAAHSDRFWWGAVHASSALWNSGLTLRATGLATYFSSGTIFMTITTLAIVSSLGLPIIFDLLAGIRTSLMRGKADSRTSSETGVGRAVWKTLPQWEAGAAFVLLIGMAALLFFLETPWRPDIVWQLPDEWVPARPFDLGPEHVSLRDDMSHGARWTAGVFVSATVRSAGLQSIPLSQGAVSWPSYGLILANMLIGGSAGGLAGGLHTSCFLMLGLCLVVRKKTWMRTPGGAAVRGTIIRGMLLLLTAGLALNAAGFLTLAATTDGSTYALVFDSMAACNSVGLSSGLLLHLTATGRIVIIGLMLAGRIVPAVCWARVARDVAGRPRGTDNITDEE